MFMNPGRNMSVGFTYITGVTASTEKLINSIGLQTIWEKRDANLNVLKTILILVQAIQKTLNTEIFKSLKHMKRSYLT